MSIPLVLTPIPNIPLISHGDDLAEFIRNGLNEAPIELQDGDVIIIAQKIVSKSEGRIVNLAEVEPNSVAVELAQTTEKDPRLVELILQESSRVVRARPGLIIVEHKLGFISANAGIDSSNVGKGEENVLLLPIDPDKSADAIRKSLQAQTNTKVAVLIIDSHGRAWRTGTIGITIGLSGLPGIVDLRGQEDLFGRQLQATIIGTADELAAGASLVMGQANESSPVVHARGFPYPLEDGSLSDILRIREQDLFR